MRNGVGAVFSAIFGVFWTINALSAGSGLFALFGLVLIGSAVYNAVYSFKNAAGENRYSEYDIVDSREEPDPFDLRRDRGDERVETGSSGASRRFCPYCGGGVAGDHRYCENCGSKLDG